MTSADLKNAVLLIDPDDDSRRGHRAIVAIVEELQHADAYWDAKCTSPYRPGEDPRVGAQRCYGENHSATCPRRVAWQDMKKASEKRRVL